MASEYPVTLTVIQVNNLRAAALQRLAEYKPPVAEDVAEALLSAEEARAVKAARLAKAHFSTNAPGVVQVVAALFDLDPEKLAVAAGISTSSGSYNLPKGFPIVMTGNSSQHDYALNRVAFFEGSTTSGASRQFDDKGFILRRGNNAPCYAPNTEKAKAHGTTWRPATPEEVNAECDRVIALLEENDRKAKEKAADPANVGF